MTDGPHLELKLWYDHISHRLKWARPEDIPRVDLFGERHVMAETNRRIGPVAARTDSVTYDAGLRSFMLSVYNYMAIGVGLTGLAAYGLYAYAATNDAVFQAVFHGPLAIVILLAPLLYGLYLIFRMQAMSVSAARNGFFIYAALVGFMLSSLFVAYTHQSIERVFFVTAAMFAATSLWGYTTKRDLTSFGSFLSMGLIGVVIAMVVNMFLQSTALQFALSIMGVFIFTGLTAYDTQKLKDVYVTYSSDGTALAHSAVRGALSLYLDFINLFLFMLRFMGDRRN